MALSTLSVTSEALPLFLGQPALEPVRLSGHEGLNSLFEYELLLKTPDSQNLVASKAADFDLDAFIGREISCRIQLDGAGAFLPGAVGDAADHLGAGTREINALITDAALWGEEGRHVQYRLTLRPWLHLATLNTDCRIFQNQTVVELLDTLLADYPFPVDKRLIETYPPRDYQTQFNESDHAFFSRLCQEWGISYFFEHADGHHRLVLIDNMGAYQKSPSAAYQAVDYHPPGWKTDAEYIHSFVPQHQLTSGRYSTRDYDYTRPRADLSASRADPRPTGQNAAEVYQWHDGLAGSHYAQPRAGTSESSDPQAEGRQFALLRMQALRSHGARAQASGNLRGMVPGCSFQLQNHPRDKANAEYLVLETQFLIEDVGQASQIPNAAALRKQSWRVEVDFTAHPMAETLRPALTVPKPQNPGLQSALVVGPAGENIWTDALGRIKVQFPWDREGQKNQHSSCWVRVSSDWAGNQLGSIQLPRIGQEVLISFIGNDPDLPVCTGRVHNQNNLPPWSLPGQAALSGWRSRELNPDGGNSAAGGSTHVLSDDTAGQQQVQLKSDHRHSQLSLGFITRIEDNAGRKDARGVGYELATEAHGVLRAGEGMLISTEIRPRAGGHAKAMDETVQRLTSARDQHEALAQSAEQAQAQTIGDQDEVAKSLKAQNKDIQGLGAGADREGRFPELAAPHLVLASPAGIETTTAGSTHIASEMHNAFTSCGHTSISAGRSFLASVKEAIRLFALKAGIKLVAGSGDIDVTALTNGIHLLAKLDITQTARRITISAKGEVVVNGGGSYTRWSGAGIEHGTNGTWVEHAASHGMTGPKSLDQLYPLLPTPSLIERQSLREEHFVLVEHASGLRLPHQKYRISFAGGRSIEGHTNAEGETDVVQSMVTQTATVEMLRNTEDGVMARYEPFVTTPADHDYAAAPLAEKRVTQKIGGKTTAPNDAAKTSAGKEPTLTSCDPNNWGMRTHNLRQDQPTRYEYPVIRDYVTGVKPALMAFDWGQKGMGPAQRKAETAESWRGRLWEPDRTLRGLLIDLFKKHIYTALQAGSFGLPKVALPPLVIYDHAFHEALQQKRYEAAFDRANPSWTGPRPPSTWAAETMPSPTISGSFSSDDWYCAICEGAFLDIAQQLAPREVQDMDGTLAELAGTMFHEARHAQQYFWMAALVLQYPDDYAHVPKIVQALRYSFPAHILQCAETTPVPDEPAAKAGLHRMVIGWYYRVLRFFEASHERTPWATMYPDELRNAERAAYALLQHTTPRGGLTPIDVRRMGDPDPNETSGYNQRPWENDAHAMERVLRVYWRDGGDDPYGAVPQQDSFCSRAFNTANDRRPAQNSGDAAAAARSGPAAASDQPGDHDARN